MERDEFVKLWAAQGFAGRGNEWKGMEDICRDYFDELVSASFLQLRTKDYSSQGDYYVIHDLLFDIAEKVTGSDCFRIENLQSPEVEVPPDVRHVFLQTYDVALITEKICKLDNLRTLIIGQVECVEEKVLKSMFERLRKLRVLIMTRESSKKMFVHIGQFSVPASISQLRHLWYLAIRSGSFGRGGVVEQIRLVLPGTLTKLYHMQVLDFYCIEELVFSSCEGTIGLINLEHLIGPENLKIPNISRLTSLRSMTYFAARKEQGYELKQLGNLNKLSGGLCITWLENVESRQEAIGADLSDKEGLRELTLQWYNLAHMDFRQRMRMLDRYEVSPEVQTEVLEGLCPPTGLESLRIIDYQGLRYPSWMVCEHNGGPKYLKYLTLDGWMAEPGPELRGFFSHLRVLTIEDCSWQALPDCMEHLASLRTLQIYRCRNIQSFPTLPQSLQIFILRGCTEVLVCSCKTVGSSYWRKIQHIPCATIGDCEFKMGAVLQERGSESSLSEETSAVKRKFQWRLKKKSARLTRLSRVH